MTKAKGPTPTVPKKIRSQIEEAMKWKAESKFHKDESKLLDNKAKETLLPIMAAYGIKDYLKQGMGKITMKVSKGSSINAAKLREQLLIEGISVTKIDSIISRASNTWESEYVEFKEDKA